MWWESLRQFERSAVDFQGANYFVESPNIIEPRSPRQIVFVVIHTTGRDTISGAVNRFLADSSNVSIHYIVDRDGTIVQMVREANVAGHCANLDTLHNRMSIGIEHVCSPRSEITDAQYQRSVELVRWLCDRHAIPKEHNPTPLAPGIRGHSEEYTRSTHNCPNRHWDWARYLDLLSGN